MTQSPTVVETVSGRVRGVRVDGATLFAGIPYAAPPVGPRRFRPPQPVEPWPRVRDAVDFGPAAAQTVFPHSSSADGSLDRGVDEAALRLHVWTPGPDDARRPVMVWLHGGGFTVGAGYARWTDGAALARHEDVVVMSCNHRLDAFGYLYLAGIGGEEYADSGNVGLLDIVAALTWVRDNIAAFGGDPGNVTLFGESGGGWKISTLLAMPAARGLFHRTIVQSGSYLRARTAEQADRAARELLALLEIPENQLHRLHEIPATRILAATAPDLGRPPTPIHSDGTWLLNADPDPAPVIDGRTLLRHPFEDGAPPESAGVPLLVGHTLHELGATTGRVPGAVDPFRTAVDLGLSPVVAGRILDVYAAELPGAGIDELMGELLSDTLFGMSAVRQAEAKVAQGDPTYFYLFAWPWAHAGNRAVHAVDVPFAFGNVVPELLGTSRDASTRTLAAQMRAAWAAFARTGDPSHPGLPEWEPYSLDRRATMVFDHESRLENDPRGARRRALDASDASALI